MLNAYDSLIIRGQVSHPYKATGYIIHGSTYFKLYIFAWQTFKKSELRGSCILLIEFAPNLFTNTVFIGQCLSPGSHQVQFVPITVWLTTHPKTSFTTVCTNLSMLFALLWPHYLDDTNTYQFLYISSVLLPYFQVGVLRVYCCI